MSLPELIQLENTDEEIPAHPIEVCDGPPCCIHHRTDHCMREFPQHYRWDRGIMERICPHGIGHPDPDDLAFHESQGRNSEGVHGCDGCCNPERKLLPSEQPDPKKVTDEEAGLTVGDKDELHRALEDLKGVGKEFMEVWNDVFGGGLRTDEPQGDPDTWCCMCGGLDPDGREVCPASGQGLTHLIAYSLHGRALEIYRSDTARQARKNAGIPDAYVLLVGAGPPEREEKKHRA